MAGIELDGVNQKVVLDSDGDTYLEAATDDTIKVYVAGAHDATISANAINVLSGTTLTIDSGATIANSGTATGFSSADPASADGDSLGTASLEWSDLFLADGGIIKFGNDQDTLLTHTDGTGLTLNSTNKLCFNDASQFVQGTSATVLSIGATDEIDLTATAVDLNGTLDVSGASTFNDNIKIIDDKGILFGTGDDMYIGTNGGETELSIGKGSTTTGGTEGRLDFIPTTDGTYLDLFSTEGKGPAHGLYQDDGDDNNDLWRYGQGSSDGDANGIISWSNYTSGSWIHKMRIFDNGNFQTSGTHAASVSFDYAEFWEWKTELANDAKITETYGMTVVLDGATVRLAETGEEAKVIGVVRPNNTSTMVGGGAEINYINKYERNVWGETQFEEYTQVTWEDTYNDIVIKHSYMKDRIPSKRIKHGAVQSQENWHTLEINFLKDGDGNFVTLVVPSTDAEKSAANYVERTTYTKDKGEHKKDDKLMREKINSSYDFTKSKSYQGRDKRRKEWCIVGLMGQVEVRDTAIVPTSWTKMKNLETGIDLYYIK